MSVEEYRKKTPVIAATLANSIITRYYKEVMQAKQQGKPIAWVGLEVPSQLFYVFDIIPVYPQYSVALQSMGNNYSHTAEALEGSWELPRDMCSEVKAAIGNILYPSISSFKIPPPDFLITHNGICLQMSKGFDFLSRYMKIPHYFIDIPQNYDIQPGSAYTDYLKKQLKGIIREIIKTFKVRFNEAKLKKLVKHALLVFTIWNEILKLCKNSPSPIDGQDLVGFLLPFTMVDFSADDGKTINMYITLYNELYKRLEEAKALHKKKEKHRILWDVLTIYRKKNFIKNILAKHGASVVITSLDITTGVFSPGTNELLFDYPLTLEKVEKSYQGMTLVSRLFGVDNIADVDKMDALYLLAKYISFSNAGSISSQCERIKNIIHEYNIDAVIMHMNQNCRAISLTQTRVMDYIMNELHIPGMIIHADSMDDRYFSRAQISTRLEAFLEGLE